MILDSITEIAVLGTAKKELNQEQKDWCATFKISLDNKEQAVLQTAVLDSEMNLVGSILESEDRGTSVERIAPIENEIDDKFVLYIETMLDDYPQLAAHFIELTFDQNKVIPKRFIPKYLDHIKTWKKDLRYDASLIAGSRAQYLAQYTQRWNFLLPTNINWETAFHKQRISHAQEIRKTDPVTALELIQTGFKENHSTERKELIQLLHVNISENDLPFLRNLSTDKSKLVRQEVYQLQAVIDPEVQETLKKEASYSVKIEKGGLLKKAKLEVVLPQSSELIDQLPPAERMGIKIGKKAEKLLNLISLLPFSFYEQEPKEVLKLFSKSEWSNVLFKGIQNAAILHQKVDWAMDLISYLQKIDLRIDPKLLDLFSNQQFNTLLITQLKLFSGEFAYNKQLGRLFRDSSQSINIENSKTIIGQLAQYYKNNNQQRNLYADDLQVVKEILARVDWSIETLPEELSDFNELFSIKQKLKESLK